MQNRTLACSYQQAMTTKGLPKDGLSRGQRRDRDGDARQPARGGGHGQSNQASNSHRNTGQDPTTTKNKATKPPQTQKQGDDQSANTGYSFEYELKAFNFNPYTCEIHKNAGTRARQLTEQHKRTKGVNTLARNDINDILCATIRHALKCWGLRLTLAMADHLWDMRPALAATVEAVLINETKWRTADQAANWVENWTKQNEVNNMRRGDLMTEPGRQLRDDVIWLLPPAWPTGADRDWLSERGASLVAKMLQADAAIRRDAPRTAAPGEKRVVGTPGLANYLANLSNLGIIIRAKTGGNSQVAATALPTTVRKMQKYLAHRGGVEVDYVTLPP